MATFITYPSGNVWTSAIKEVALQTSSSSVTIEVTAGEVSLFSESYTPSSGQFVFYGLDEIVETYMRDKRLAILKCSIKATASDGNAESQFTAFYCSRAMGASVDEWIQKAFLTPASFATLALDSPFSLSLAASSSDTTFHINGVAENADGDKLPFNFSDSIAAVAAGTVELRILGVSPQKVLETVSSQGFVRLLAYSVVAGGRSFSVFVDNIHRESCYTFIYRNMFNVRETLRLCGVVDCNMALERGKAVIGGRTVVYDVTAGRTYELTTAPLRRSEAVMLEQLQQSYDVTDINGFSVILTDDNYEYDTDLTTMKSVKLAWRYADNRVVDDTQLPDSSGIFTEEFDSRFT